ncbi:carbon-nitrogen hydrolase family protein [Sphingomonas sp.]|uniref:carbon-nitrogen hydrolase family protein n=1 Tax=Sphingomonas sp. TaxID=28214 RepID=UPI0017BBD9B2|nr:carbon-nitrogen hydrolase family protein [Sphingomonas sp.]MBA3512435.1 carbon-nitrogen hydrolase family protein [Sphingomonas sp.]
MARIALFQSCTGIDPARNAEALVAAISEASDGGAEMLFTPEMSGLLDRDAKRAAANLRSEEDDQVLAASREAAARHGMWLHLGSLAVRTDEQKLANRTFVVDPTGAVRARYDKIHLFDVDLPTGESWRESAVYRPGEGAVVVEGTPVGLLGLAICYDLRFPALFSRLAEAGAQTVAVPAAFTVPTGRAHWEVLLRARAIEAGAFVVAAAQSGRHADGRETYGHSLVIGPWGELLLDMGEDTGIGFADIELSRVEDVRRRIPSLIHRRPIAQAAVVQ